MEGRSQRREGEIKGKDRKLHGQKQGQKLAEKNYLETEKNEFRFKKNQDVSAFSLFSSFKYNNQLNAK